MPGVSRVKKYQIIGGPLDGRFANQKDWWTPVQYKESHMQKYNRPGGEFASFSNEYVRFNAGEHGSKTSCVWLHTSLLRAPVRIRQDIN